MENNWGIHVYCTQMFWATEEAVVAAICTFHRPSLSPQPATLAEAVVGWHH